MVLQPSLILTCPKAPRAEKGPTEAGTFSGEETSATGLHLMGRRLPSWGAAGAPGCDEALWPCW